MADKTLTAEEIALLETAKAKEARRLELANKRKATSEALAGESKADAFKRIAVRRMNASLDEMAKLKPLAIKANYDYTDAQVDMILSALQKELDKVKSAFATGGATKDAGFTL